MDKLLIVEDSKTIQKILEIKARKYNFEPVCVATYEDAKSALGAAEFSFALLDLVLPDAPKGEIVDLANEYKLPCVVLSAMNADDIFERINSKPIIDYVIKNRDEDIEYAFFMLVSVRKYKNKKALIVDDSAMSRKLVRNFLSLLLFDIYEAKDGKEALEFVGANNDVSLVVTDYNMPEMDGFELTLKLREMRKKDDLAIIALTGDDAGAVEAKFLKYGANAFLTKPFAKEVFNYTINNTMDFIDKISSIKAYQEKLQKINSELEETVQKQVSKIHQTEQLIIQQSKMAAMGEMISIIAHQWQQPLNILAIDAYSLLDRFEHEGVDKEYLEEFYNQTMEQINFMSHTVDDFRNFMKPTKQKCVFSIYESAQEIVRLFGGMLKPHGIGVEMPLSDDRLLTDGYVNEFKQVLLNIFTNAKDAIVEQMKKNQSLEGRISFSFSRSNDKVSVVICDNGGGIKEEIQQRLFSQYATTKGEAGTGLGLYMAKTIIEENMQGSLCVRNHENGACFTIELPAH